MPYYTKCDIEGCNTMVADAGGKVHICMDCRRKLRLSPFNNVFICCPYCGNHSIKVEDGSFSQSYQNYDYVRGTCLNCMKSWYGY